MLKRVDEDPIRPPDEQSRKICLAHRERKLAQIVAIQCEEIKAAELHLFVVPTRVQRIEIGNAVDAQDDSFAIDDELLLPVLSAASTIQG